MSHPATRPLLMRFAETCDSPGRSPAPADFTYDEERDQVVWLGNSHHTPAIELEGVAAPPTKKTDLEKGEDSKDRRMWA